MIADGRRFVHRPYYLFGKYISPYYYAPMIRLTVIVSTDIHSSCDGGHVLKKWEELVETCEYPKFEHALRKLITKYSRSLARDLVGTQIAEQQEASQ